MAYFVWITGQADITLAQTWQYLCWNCCLQSTLVPVYLCGESPRAKQAAQGKPLPPAHLPGSAHNCQSVLVERNGQGWREKRLEEPNRGPIDKIQPAKKLFLGSCTIQICLSCFSLETKRTNIWPTHSHSRNCRSQEVAAPLAREFLLAPVPTTPFCSSTLRLSVSCH